MCVQEGVNRTLRKNKIWGIGRRKNVSEYKSNLEYHWDSVVEVISELHCLLCIAWSSLRGAHPMSYVRCAIIIQFGILLPTCGMGWLFRVGRFPMCTGETMQTCTLCTEQWLRIFLMKQIPLAICSVRSRYDVACGTEVIFVCATGPKWSGKLNKHELSRFEKTVLSCGVSCHPAA